ncbi:NUDIX hydrolase [Nanoarchaeota archaeon]
MKLIKELTDKEVLGEEIEPSKEYSLRTAARAIIFDENKQIALLSMPQWKCHKLPGGGLEEKEDLKTTLVREVKEELGSDIEITHELGKIIEYKNKYSQKQVSYCFFAKLKGPKGEPSFTKEEKEAGANVIWASINEAIRLFKNDSPEEYTPKFIKARDLEFLIAFKDEKES